MVKICNKKLLAISGDKESVVSAGSATMTTKLFEIITGNKMTTETKDVGVEETHTVSTNKITLKATIAAGAKLTVFKVDQFGRDDEEIVLGSASTTGQYTISDQVLTFHTDVIGQVRVYFSTSKSVQVITAKPATQLNYRIESDMIVKDVESKDVYLAKLVIPSGQIQENFNITGSNEASEPAAIPLAIDCLEDSATGKFYEILFYEDDKQA